MTKYVVLLIAVGLALALGGPARANTLTCGVGKISVERHYHMTWYDKAAVASSRCHRKGPRYVWFRPWPNCTYRVRVDRDSLQLFHFHKACRI
jgi:hypothetical protein